MKENSKLYPRTNKKWLLKITIPLFPRTKCELHSLLGYSSYKNIEDIYYCSKSELKL